MAKIRQPFSIEQRQFGESFKTGHKGQYQLVGVARCDLSRCLALYHELPPDLEKGLTSPAYLLT